MTDELLIFVAVVVIPFPIGFALAHYRPASRNLKNAALAALPVSLPCFAWALWVTLTEDMTSVTRAVCARSVARGSTAPFQTRTQ